MDIVDFFIRLSESATLCEMSWSEFYNKMIEIIVDVAPNKKVAHLIRHGKWLTKKKNIKRAICEDCKKENSNESSND